MISLNEIARLINQIDALLDEPERGLYSVRAMLDYEPEVHMDYEAFLVEFVDYEIEVDEEADSYPYTLRREIFGVKFFAFLNAERILELKESMPEQFEYIQTKLQEEPA